MRILVTGYKGFIASNMIRALADHDITTYEWGETWPGVLDYDWVIHMGAISATTERDIDKVFKQNYEFSVMVFDECKTFGVNLQYSSSASVYGQGTEFKETSLVDPQSPYAWSKYLFERYAQQHQGGNIVQGFRYFNVYGPGEEHKGNQASPFSQFKLQAEVTGAVKLFENSDQYKRDFVHVDQVTDTHKRFFNVRESGIWNIGTGTTMSFKEVALQFSDNLIEVPMPEVLKGSYQKYTCADMTKTNNTLSINNSL